MTPPITVRRISTLLFIFVLLAAAIPFQVAKGQSNTLSFKAEADAHVDRANPNANYGSKTYLTVDNSPALRSYVRFNVSGLKGAQIISARLRLYSLYASSSGFSVVKISNNSWSETGITYKTAPTLGSTIRTSGSFNANTWLDLDVTGVVTGEGQVTFALTPSSSNAFTLASREREYHIYAPILMVMVAPLAPTLAPTMAPTAVPTQAPTAAPTAAPTNVPSGGQVMPYGVSGNWNLKFADDFNGDHLDLNKWEPNWLAGNDTTITKPINGHELSCYDPAQVSVAGGNLKLSAVARNCQASNGTTYSYASGIVTSNPHYTFTYGYMEARVWLDGSTTISNWPAFWADGTGQWPTTGEIDVMEGLGGKAAWHYHYGTVSSPQSAGGSPALSNPVGWHIFAADWQPNAITFYYDGISVGQVTSDVVNSQMFLILNYGVSTSISPPVKVSSEFLVDYVRVWQK